MFKSKNSAIRTEQKLQKPFKQLLHQYPKMPVPKTELYETYFTFMDERQMDDENSKLLQKINETNQKSIFCEFKCFMHKVFENLEGVFNKIENTKDLKRLDMIVLKNAPNFILEQQNQPQKSKISSISTSKISQTPGGEQQSEKINENNRQDIIFSYLFEKIHILLAKYKQYYQMESVQDLEMEIYRSFSTYVEENCGSFQNLEKKQSGKSITSEQIKEKSQQKLQQNQQEAKRKSNLVDHLIDVVIQNAQDAKIIKKIEDTQKNKPGIKVKDYEVSPLRIIGNASSLIQNVYKDGLTKTLTSVFHYARQKSLKNAIKPKINEQEEVFALKICQTILNTYKRHNLTKDYGLPAEQFQLVEDFMRGSNQNNFQIMKGLFTQTQKQSLIEILKEIVDCEEINLQYGHILEKIGAFLNMFVNLKTKESKELSEIREFSNKQSSKKGIKTTLSTINTISQLPNTFYFIHFLFKQIHKGYSPGSRRIMIRICHEVEERFKKMYSQGKEYRRFCLVHALKVLESEHVKRSEVCKIITNQKPFRQSRLPLVHENKQYFEEFDKEPCYKMEEAQQALQIQLARIHIQEQKKKYKEVPKLQLLKLSHSKYRKTVTILVSGFLSEDTNKFEEWMGVLQPTYDSQIYALKWQSKTIENILAYTIDACKDIALAGAGIGLIGGPYFKAAMVLKEIFTKYNKNPFIPCFDVATTTGVFLADLLISLFDGHFINLAGFSLGTQVISSALYHLKSKGKLHMINRIVTMGGVADKKQFSELLDRVQQNKSNPIEIAWTNVYCQKDNILRYLLRVSMPSITPIGLSQFVPNFQDGTEQEKNMKKYEEKKARAYQVDNINVTQFVDGHLSYRANMKTVARLIGIKDE